MLAAMKEQIGDSCSQLKRRLTFRRWMRFLEDVLDVPLDNRRLANSSDVISSNEHDLELGLDSRRQPRAGWPALASSRLAFALRFGCKEATL